MKIVRNNDYGGYGLSPLAVLEYAKLKGIKLFAYENPIFNKGQLCKKLTNEEAEQKKQYDVDFSTVDYGEFASQEQISETCFYPKTNIERNDPTLVEVVESLGKKANGDYAHLIVVEIPDDIDWDIEEYDGWESVVEKHRSW